MAAFAAVYKPPQAAGFRGGYRRFAAALPLATKDVQPRFARGNTPLSPPTAVLLLKGSMSLDFRVASLPLQIQFLCHPGGGSLLYASPCANLSSSLYSAAKTSPSGGGAVGRRGAFPSRQRRGCMVFPRPQGGLPVFPGRKPGYKGFLYIAPQAPPQPSQPKTASNLRPLGPVGPINPRLRSRRQSLAPWAVFVAFFPFFLGLVGHSGLEQKMSSLPLLYVFFTIMEPQVGQN